MEKFPLVLQEYHTLSTVPSYYGLNIRTANGQMDFEGLIQFQIQKPLIHI